ncbi:MAG: hypothetical protein KBD90_01075 [Alphaproteobacteria bacterium]|nr:hypothetical protein [Alphaproteobacteria bacterium]
MNNWLHKFMEKPDISDKPDKPDISDKWDENLENMPGGGPDKPDRLDPSLNLSGLSGSPWALLGENLSNMPKIGPDISDNTDKPDISDKPDKWDENLENMPGVGPDKPDRLGPNLNLSGLSGSPWDLLRENLNNMPKIGPDISDKPDKWDENLENMPGGEPDKPDRLDPSLNLSGLSGSPWGLLREKVENNPSKGGDKSARFNSKTNVSVLSVAPQGLLDNSSLLDDFEERLAIAEYDGQQSPLQAQRIAYQDAFIVVLNTLPYEEEEGYYDEDWLTRRIKVAQMASCSRVTPSKINVPLNQLFFNWLKNV